jgi:hypothetical protein
MDSRILRSLELGGARRTVRFVAVAVLLMFVLSACVTTIPAQPAGETGASAARLSDIADYSLPDPEAVIVPDVTAVINTEGSRANVRTGPELDAPIVAKADPGDEFKVIGSSEDGEWWQVCCVRGQMDAAGEATEPAWLAATVVDLVGNADAVPVVQAIMPETLEASWRFDWHCGSDRCEINECGGVVDAKADADGNEQWLQVEHTPVWDEGCFDEVDPWVFEVDRFTGKERSGQLIDNFVYNYWMGAQPGPATDVYTLDDGRNVVVWCSGPHELEIEESDGWTTVYKGSTCHDVQSGELVFLEYTKRWLFTGEYGDQRYERAYFGDFETYEQRLVDTNVDLLYVEKQ